MTDYRYSDGNGSNSDSDGLDPRGTEVAASGFRRLPFRQQFMVEVGLTIFPWLVSLLLGVLTALTGSFIALNCDFLGDLRFGFCRGMSFADRNRCCGGSENVDFLSERCVEPAVGPRSKVQWIPWAEFFGVDNPIESWAGYALSLLVYVFNSMVYTGLATFLVYEYCQASRGSGIPEVKAAVSGFDMPQSFSGMCLLVKTLGLSLVVGAGLSLGQEGPMVHIGVCWAYVLQRVFHKLGLPGEDLPLHELACVGAGAGIAAAFGAPLGGVLFAVEELGSARELSRRTLLFAFMAAFSASFTVKYLNLSGANKLTLFALSLPTYNPRKEWIAWEMAAFLLIGAIGGLVGVAFIKANMWVVAARRRCLKEGRLWMLPGQLQRIVLGSWPLRRFCHAGAVGNGAAPGGPRPSLRTLTVLEGVLIAFVTALLNYPFTTLLRTLSMEAIHALFETCPHSRAQRFGLCGVGGFANMSISGAASLLLAAGIRVLQTSYTNGAAVPSGLFVPSLFIGANIGRFAGNMLHMTQNADSDFRVHIEPGMFAMVGAVAVMTGFCRMTVSVTVMMFELTGELNYVVPFMCAVLTAKLVGDSLSHSIYDAHAHLNGYASIEEQRDVRLETYVADLAVPLTSGDLLDVSAPVPLHVLRGHARGPPEGAQSETATWPLQRCRPGESSVVLLVEPGSSGGRATSSSDVLGVLDRSRLQRWLVRQGNATAAFYTFAGVSRTGGARADGSHPGTPQELSIQPAVLEAEFTGLGEETPAGEAAAPLCCTVADASELVDTRIARLSPLAPLLTAHCLFKQKPKLQYCVCIDDRHSGRFCVLSRADFELALRTENFPLAREPYHSSNNRERRSVGAAAVREMLGPTWARMLAKVGLASQARVLVGNGGAGPSRGDEPVTVGASANLEMSRVSAAGPNSPPPGSDVAASPSPSRAGGPWL